MFIHTKGFTHNSVKASQIVELLEEMKLSPVIAGINGLCTVVSIECLTDVKKVVVIRENQKSYVVPHDDRVTTISMDASGVSFHVVETIVQTFGGYYMKRDDQEKHIVHWSGTQESDEKNVLQTS